PYPVICSKYMPTILSITGGLRLALGSLRHPSRPTVSGAVARPSPKDLAHLVSTPFQAGGIGPIVIAAPRLGLSLGLLLGLGRLLVPAALPHQARHRAGHPRSSAGVLHGHCNV